MHGGTSIREARLRGATRDSPLPCRDGDGSPAPSQHLRGKTDTGPSNAAPGSLGIILSGSDLDFDLMLSTSREETEAYPLPIPVVGIGASAGGLEAIRELIREIPADANLALLVVMHLDPQQPSHLVEILGRSWRECI